MSMCGGPLGFGSREADSCLKQQRGVLSLDCNLAIAQTEAAFRELKGRGENPQPPHLGHGGPHSEGGFVLFLVFVLCLCAGCGRKLSRPHDHDGLHGSKKGEMKAVLAALADPANTELKAALEDAAGVTLPSGPGWKRRVFAALNANPELKAAVDTAVAESSRLLRDGDDDDEADEEKVVLVDVEKQGSAGGRSSSTAAPVQHPGAVCAARVMKCWAFVMAFILVAFFLNLVSRGPPPPRDDEEEKAAGGSEDNATNEDGSSSADGGPPPRSPLEGFLFSIFSGFFLIFVCAALFRLLKKCATLCCGATAADTAEAAAAAAATGSEEYNDLEQQQATTLVCVDDDMATAKSAAKADYSNAKLLSPSTTASVVVPSTAVRVAQSAAVAVPAARVGVPALNDLRKESKL
jgi:hypothetical protein